MKDINLSYIGVCRLCGMPMYYDEDHSATYVAGRSTCKHKLAKKPKNNMVLRSLNLKVEQAEYITKRAYELRIPKGVYLRALIDEDMKIFATLPEKKKRGRPPVATAKNSLVINEI